MATVLPSGVSDRDIIVTSRLGGRSRRLHAEGGQKRQLQSATDLVYLVDIFPRGEVTTAEILATVNSVEFANGLDQEDTTVLSVTTTLSLVPAPFKPPAPPPSPPSPPPFPPREEEVVQVDVVEDGSGKGDRRKLQGGVPLSAESLFTFFTHALPYQVSDRDIRITPSRGGRPALSSGRRLDEGESRGRQLQHPTDMVYLVDIFVRSTLSSGVIVDAVTFTTFTADMNATMKLLHRIHAVLHRINMVSHKISIVYAETWGRNAEIDYSMFLSLLHAAKSIVLFDCTSSDG
eukprot:6183238-Pleurochrysis_carterae.AAC.1